MYWSSLRQIGLSRAQLQKMESLRAVKVTEVELNRDPYATIEQVIETVELNESQATAVHAIRDAEAGETLLLHGVTGSGKTEVYLEVSFIVLIKMKNARIRVVVKKKSL
jgi:primosomal protein N' (replication factor Y)